MTPAYLPTSKAIIIAVAIISFIQNTETRIVLDPTYSADLFDIDDTSENNNDDDRDDVDKFKKGDNSYSHMETNDTTAITNDNPSSDTLAKASEFSSHEIIKTGARRGHRLTKRETTDSSSSKGNRTVDFHFNKITSDGLSKQNTSRSSNMSNIQLKVLLGNSHSNKTDFAKSKWDIVSNHSNKRNNTQLDVLFENKHSNNDNFAQSKLYNHRNSKSSNSNRNSSDTELEVLLHNDSNSNRNNTDFVQSKWDIASTMSNYNDSDNENNNDDSRQLKQQVIDISLSTLYATTNDKTTFELDHNNKNNINSDDVRSGTDIAESSTGALLTKLYESRNNDTRLLKQHDSNNSNTLQMHNNRTIINQVAQGTSQHTSNNHNTRLKRDAASSTTTSNTNDEKHHDTSQQDPCSNHMTTTSPTTSQMTSQINDWSSYWHMSRVLYRFDHVVKPTAPPNQPDVPDSCADVSEQWRKRSDKDNILAACPWKWVIRDLAKEFGPDIYPKYVREAECLCETCLTGNESQDTLGGTKVLKSVTILQRTKCADGRSLVSTRQISNIAIGCMCRHPVNNSLLKEQQQHNQNLPMTP